MLVCNEQKKINIYMLLEIHVSEIWKNKTKMMMKLVSSLSMTIMIWAEHSSGEKVRECCKVTTIKDGSCPHFITICCVSLCEPRVRCSPIMIHVILQEVGIKCNYSWPHPPPARQTASVWAPQARVRHYTRKGETMKKGHQVNYPLQMLGTLGNEEWCNIQYTQTYNFEII